MLKLSTLHMIEGMKYCVSFIDDCSRMIWIYFMCEKLEVFPIFKKWKTGVETQKGKKAKYLRSNNGGEYISNKFNLYCENEGITRHLTTVYTPQQNNVAKWQNTTLLERSWSMLSQVGFS